MKKIERIKKLLALSKSSNEHEAALALSAAIKIAAEEGVDLDELGLDEEDILSQDYTVTAQAKSPERWQSYLWIRVARIFGCAQYIRKFWNEEYNERYCITLVGKQSDIEIADYVGTYLHRQLLALARKEIASVCKRRKISRRKLRDDFLLGAANRVIEKAEALYKNEQPGVSAGFEMILARSQKAKAWMEEKYTMKPVKYAGKVDEKSFNAGFARAGAISVNKGVAGSASSRRRIEG